MLVELFFEVVAVSLLALESQRFVVGNEKFIAVAAILGFDIFVPSSYFLSLLVVRDLIFFEKLSVISTSV